MALCRSDMRPGKSLPGRLRIQRVDHDKIAAYIHANTFSTVAGEIAFAQDGEWREPRTLFTQFQNVVAGDLDQFRDTKRQVILWPAKYATGNMIYPYSEAKK
jgi:branched-chain amino acid transport system substrate-binding protein